MTLNLVEPNTSETSANPLDKNNTSKIDFPA